MDDIDLVAADGSEIVLESGDAEAEINLDGGLSGPPGPTGPAGPPGIGSPGEDGTDGINGATWLNGSGVPNPGLGSVYDYYLDNDSGDYYLKNDATTWVFQGTFAGPPGPPGPATDWVINVKDHGALGDGTTDDTAAIQDAIDVASVGDIVFMPPGTYIVDPAVSLHLTAGITFAGVSRLSILKIKDNSDVLNNLVKVENADRVILRDFSIDGNRANQDPSDLVAVHYGVYIASSNDCRVHNVYVYNTTGVGVHVYDSVGTVVSNCESSGNRYHGFECEQATSTIWQSNRGHNNTRHGIFVSPGEVGGTGSIGNIIDGNSFDNNESYGIAFGIDAGGLSIGLTKDNVVTNNSVINNTEYGISIYRVDDTLISNNVVAYNGFFGIYLYRAERNQVIGNRLRNNSQVTNGAYDEILLEGANDGQASQHNLIANNFIYIDGVNKANYAIREGSTGDGPNVIKDNYVPNSGVSGRILVQHPNTSYVFISDTPVDNLSSLRTYEDGVAIAPNSALPGSSMGLDAPFGTAALRFINNNAGGNIQFVATDGNLDIYAGGNNIGSFTSTYLSMHSNPIQDVDDPINPQDAATMNYIDTRTGENFRIVSAAPTTIAEGIATLITNKVEKSGDTMTGSLTIGSGSGDVLNLDGTGSNNTILRFRDDAAERAALFSLNGNAAFNVRSQAALVLISNNSGTPKSITMNNGIVNVGGQTISNARINSRIGTVASSATITPSADDNDQYNVTALATNATIAAPSGTPADGDKLIIRIKDNGTTRTLTWNAIYREGYTLPTATTPNATHYIGLKYNAQESKWDVLAVQEIA